MDLFKERKVGVLEEACVTVVPVVVGSLELEEEELLNDLRTISDLGVVRL